MCASAAFGCFVIVCFRVVNFDVLLFLVFGLWVFVGCVCFVILIYFYCFLLLFFIVFIVSFCVFVGLFSCIMLWRYVVSFYSLV